MAKTSVETVTLSVTGDGVNEQTVVTIQTNLAALGERVNFAYASGFQTVWVNATSNPVRLNVVPPTNSAITKTLKGITGDTGIVLDPKSPFSLTLSPGASFGLTMGGTENLNIWVN